ncbi:hypothetical protein M4578_18700 [Salipiger sp. P9]|uniref:hypothetical protein n=1 Tax=Salipiger pentaromativorans TaxID=2943193 RepID=UPI002157A8C5|nr:hypothetical protein [Salipiger pentaromativorans]MCR8549863.1 hypothetical protein [Salipiger pentaromativorans]
MKYLALLLLLATPAHADGFAALPYAELEATPHRRVSFDILPPATEPGHVFNAPLRFDGLSIGERLAGQTCAETVTAQDRFDALRGVPALPLGALAGARGQNLAVAQHAGFGSNALFPLGPRGATSRGGRGEGAVALLFDEGQWRLGLRLHADYADPLGARAPRGTITLRFWDGAGRLIAEQALRAVSGVVSMAWQSDVPIRALTIVNTDPGGIAVDDILYQTAPATG